MRVQFATLAPRVLLGPALCAGLLLVANPSQAQQTDQPIIFQLYAGFLGDSGVDDFEIEQTDVADPEDEDLETHLGVGGMYLALVAPGLRIGGRLAYLSAMGEDEDQDNHYAEFALGPWLRCEFVPGKARPFVDAGLGLNLLFIDGDYLEASGLGLHLMLGGGVAFSVSDAVSMHGAIYYGYALYPSMDGEADLGILGQYDVEGDVTVQRGLLAVGVQF
jgi:hypothetical protein